MSSKNNLDKNRLYKNYYLNVWGDQKHSCVLCELSDECDRLSDDLNDIYYLMCTSPGIIKDVNYKKNHPNAYFKKII